MATRIESKRQKARGYRQARDALRSARLQSEAGGLHYDDSFEANDDDVFDEPTTPLTPHRPAPLLRERLSSLPAWADTSGTGGDNVAASRLARVVVLEASVRKWENVADRFQSKCAKLGTQLQEQRKEHDAALSQTRAELAQEKATRSACDRELISLRKKLKAQQGEVDELRRMSRQSSESDGVVLDLPVSNQEIQIATLQAELEQSNADLVETRNQLHVAQEQLDALGELFKGAVQSGNDGWLANVVDLSQLREEFQVDQENMEECEALLDETTAELESLRGQLDQSQQARDAIMAHLSEMESELHSKGEEIAGLRLELCTAKATAQSASQKADALASEMEAAAEQSRAARESTEIAKVASVEHDLSHSKARLEDTNEQLVQEVERVRELEALVKQLSDEKLEVESELASVHRQWEAKRESLQKEVIAIRATATSFADQLEIAKQRVTEAQDTPAPAPRQAESRKTSAFLKQFGWQAEKLLAAIDTDEATPVRIHERTLRRESASSGRSSPLLNIFKLSTASSSEEPTLEERNHDIQRANLVMALQHSIHELVDTFEAGNVLTDDDQALSAFCIVMEALLNYGVRNKTSWYERGSDKPNFWPFMRAVLLQERSSNLESVESLPGITTSWGRGRAWIRMALMEKTLCSYLQSALSHTSLITNYYHPYAVFRKPEAESVGELLVAVSNLDCNLCLKDNELDYTHNNQVDYARYLAINMKRELSQLSEDLVDV